jgi:hypothetical protein
VLWIKLSSRCDQSQKLASSNPRVVTSIPVALCVACVRNLKYLKVITEGIGLSALYPRA